MAVELSKYEGVALAFLEQHAIGTMVGAEQVMAFAEGHGDGLATDLLIGDPAKRLSAVKRHLNHGGSSRALPEAHRFVLLGSAAHGVFEVRRLADHAKDEAEVALEQSAKGALAPIRKGLRHIESIKMEELTDEERTSLEAQMQYLIDLQKPIRDMMRNHIQQQWVGMLAAKGFTEEQARSMIDLSPAFTRYNRMLKAVA
jgi:hypothetical protein